ncbi:MAG TPA: hypothetical protein PLA05_02685 [bacterium]|nr:MAG: hypothetical protein BWX82_00221 [Parcubacteria group bacterium ADurb.Bin115]HNU81672.1 hypothetical protein [bacterium]HOD87258.1 hypothetical protein [bacterium]HPW05849.1 hypothetical protein [bacterium]HPY99615.1 hypothetical protein [bacterium]
MDKRQKLGLLIIVIGLAIIAVIIYFIFIRQAEVPATTIAPPTASTTVPLPTEPVESDITPSDKPRNYQQYDISKEPEHQTDAADVAKLSAAFAERLGSFSNQSDYSNFEDLDLFMTASMRDWAKSYVAKMRADNPYNGSYYGITTKAISAEVKSFDDDKGTAEIIVGTQRREVGADGGERNFQQDLRLTFLKINDQWLVDGAYWLK